LYLISAIAIFVIGLAFGSFLNVCISRIPNDLSIVTPRSRCPHCKVPIAWRDNIPVVSWLLLGRSCRTCGQSISTRYPAVEVLTVFLFVACYVQSGLSWITIKDCVFCFLVVGLMFMDAETGLLPAEFTYTGLALGLVFAWFVPLDAQATKFLMSGFGYPPLGSASLQSLLDALIAVVFGAGFLGLMWGLYYLVRKRHGLWFGDIAMTAMLAAFLGLKLTVLVVALSPILGLVCAAAFLTWQSRIESTHNHGQVIRPSAILARKVPFGVFLGSSALIALFFGEPIWNWYLGFF
jgi:leader peptidase (prepilin peptidase)/N-methyltransferase